MDNARRFITNIIVSVFVVIVGLKMWFTAEGYATPLALVIIIIGVSALESNVTLILKRERSNKAGQADR